MLGYSATCQADNCGTLWSHKAIGVNVGSPAGLNGCQYAPTSGGFVTKLATAVIWNVKATPARALRDLFKDEQHLVRQLFAHISFEFFIRSYSRALPLLVLDWHTQHDGKRRTRSEHWFI